jgi:SAM-dependent methyltransferase
MSTPFTPAALGRERRTDPGPPMIGPYSTNQTDDFYAALSVGEANSAGIANYLQRLLIAQRCRPGDKVVDVCCGQGLQLPVMYRYSPDLASYTGLDISPTNLAVALARRDQLERTYGAHFDVSFQQCDVAEPWPITGTFDIAIYTAGLEHLPRHFAVTSISETASALAPTGTLYLSTPNTTEREQRDTTHVFEWAHEDLLAILEEVGLQVDDVIGVLPPHTAADTEQAIADRYGADAIAFYRRMQRSVPEALLGPVIATALVGAATEILYVCSRRPA